MEMPTAWVLPKTQTTMTRSSGSTDLDYIKAQRETLIALFLQYRAATRDRTC